MDVVRRGASKERGVRAALLERRCSGYGEGLCGGREEVSRVMKSVERWEAPSLPAPKSRISIHLA